MDTDDLIEVKKPDMEQLRRIAGHLLPANPNLELITRLAAVGITLDVWRNSPVEDWHVAGRITDGAMMRINSHTTAQALDEVRHWCSELGLEPKGTTDDLELIGPAEFDELAIALLQWVTDRERLLPSGQTLGELGGVDLADFAEHAEAVFGTMMLDCDTHGVAYPILTAAVRGSTTKWWGTPAWPTRVATFMAALSDRSHPHWGADGSRFREDAPGIAADRETLRQLLLDKPWELDDAAAQWVVGRGLGWVRLPSDPGRQLAAGASG